MTNMKRIITTATVLCTAFAALTGCNDSVEPTVYDGPEYVMFQDTLNEFYVSQTKNTIKVGLSATKTTGYDRIFGVEAVANGSTAVEDRHFSLKSHNVTIKAGQLAATVEIDIYTENFGKTDSLGTSLRLVVPDELNWELYGNQTKISLQKYCDLNMESWLENEKAELDPQKYNYANYILYATFPYSQDPGQFTKILVKVTKDPGHDRQMIIKSPFQEGYDLKIRFQEGDPDKSFVTMLKQRAFADTNALWVDMYTLDLYPSYYDSCKRYIELYIQSSVEGYTPFDVYPYYMQWITERRAEEIRNTGF